MISRDLKNLFVKNDPGIHLCEEETPMSYSVNFSIDEHELKICLKDELEKFIKALKIKGRFIIKIQTEDQTNLCLIDKVENIAIELDNLYDELPKKNEKLFFIMVINKVNLEGEVRIYSLKSFKDKLLSLSYENLVNFFSDCIKASQLRFHIVENNEEYYIILANGFRIVNKTNIYNNCEVIDKNFRNKILSEGNNYCINQGFDKCILIPEDFYNDLVKEDDFFYSLAKKILFIISVKCISNYYKLENNILYFKIIGYKTLEYELNLEDIFNDNDIILNIDTYYEIYKWVYKNENIEEKIEMARNLISIYVKPNLEIDKNIIKSLNSALKIYLKENVDKYIEARNLIVKEIRNLTSKTDEVVKSFIGNIKNNLLAQFTFIITVIVMNLIYSNSVDKLFTKEISAVIVAFVIISILNAIVHRYYIYKNEMKRYEQFYNRIKDCYDFLDPNDLENILKKDKYFNEDKVYIQSQIKMYYMVWIISQLVILLVLVIIPHIFKNLDFVLKYVIIISKYLK